MRGSMSPAKHAVKSSIMPLASRRLGRETAGTFVNQQLGPRSCVNPAVNQYLRHESGLGARLRELAILATARELDSQFEWAAHEKEALRAGVPAEVIDTIKHRRDLAALDPADAVV